MPEKRFASINHGAKHIDASPRYVRYLAEEGKLTRYRIGRLIRIDLNELEALLIAEPKPGDAA